VRGFTLVEIVVAGAIFVVVLAALLAALSGGGSTVRRGMDILDLYSTTGLAIEYVKHDLRLLYGPVPTLEFVGQKETTFRFLCVDAIDEANWTAKLRSTVYRFQRSDGHHKTELVREVDGRRTSFGYDRDVSLLIGADPRAFRTDRAMEVSFAFPQDRTSSNPVPGIQLNTVALNSVRGFREPPAARTGDSRKVNLFPALNGPWTCGGDRLNTDPKELFPPEACPVFANHGY
jgi:hypothetical protein